MYNKSAIIVRMTDEASDLLVEKIVDELTRLRKEKGLSHEKMAEKTGLSRPAISFIESHKHIPTLLNCARMAKALDVSLGELIVKLEQQSS